LKSGPIHNLRTRRRSMFWLTIPVHSKQLPISGSMSRFAGEIRRKRGVH
jgi:hypothetical protein